MPSQLAAYRPNPLLGWLYERFFQHIQIDEDWARAVRDADSRGTVVYVLRNLSFVDFLALDHLTKRLRLPEVRFANDLGLWILEPMGRGWFEAVRRSTRVGGTTGGEDVERLREAVSSGASAALFLKRPPDLLEASLEPPRVRRGKSEGDVFIRTLFDVQRRSKRPVLLVPQVFVWSKRPDDAARGALDSLLGPREWPGKIRTVAQFLANYGSVTLRAGEPVDLREFLAQPGEEAITDDVRVRRLVYLLLRRLERERRAVLGPSRKPPDRLREEVLRSPRLQKIIGDMAGEGRAERRVMTWRAMAMLREMEADLDMGTVAKIDALVDQLFPKMYSGLEVDEIGIERLRRASKDGTVILLPSHKSHIDYVILAWVLYTRHIQLPLIAAGDNLNFFPLGPVLRRAGAFYIRRSFKGDRLYGAVVDAYMRRLLIDGWSLEFFLEGGRSRTGKLLPPKLGLLSLVVDAALSVPGRTVYFAPVSIAYERVVEEESYVRELSGGEKKKEDVVGLLSSAEKLRGRYGRVSVQLGDMLTLDQVLADLDAESGSDRPARADTTLTPSRRRALVTRLAYRTMNEINQATAVTAGALVATALLTHPRRAISHDELIASCRRLARMLRGFGARFSHSLLASRPDELPAQAIKDACELFIKAGHVQVRLASESGGDALYVVPDEARLSLDLSKNILVHFFVERALLATALLARDRPGDTELLKERVLALSRLLKFEFHFRADASFDRIFEDTLSGMEADGEVSRGSIVAVRGGESHQRLTLYADVVKNFLESYRVAARSLGLLLKGTHTEKDLARRALALGERMHLSEEITKRESLSRPVFENAYASFVDQGYLARRDGKLALAPSYANADALKTVERKIAGFLERRA